MGLPLPSLLFLCHVPVVTKSNQTDGVTYLKLKQLLNALKIQSFVALQAAVDGLAAVKLNPDCKCSLCFYISAHTLMMCYIP